MRKGKVGDWTEHLSEKESESFDAITESYFRNTSRKFLEKL